MVTHKKNMQAFLEFIISHSEWLCEVWDYVGLCRNNPNLAYGIENRQRSSYSQQWPFSSKETFMATPPVRALKVSVQNHRKL